MLSPLVLAPSLRLNTDDRETLATLIAEEGLYKLLLNLAQLADTRADELADGDWRDETAEVCELDDLERARAEAPRLPTRMLELEAVALPVGEAERVDRVAMLARRNREHGRRIEAAAEQDHCGLRHRGAG